MEQPKKRTRWFHRAYNASRDIVVKASNTAANGYANVTGAKSATVVKEFHDDMEQVYAAMATRIIQLEARQRQVATVAWIGLILSAVAWVGHLIGYLR